MKNITNVTRAALLATTFCLFFLAGNAQTIQEVQNSFNLYKQSALQEKIFVHTDKTVYLPGEILWFKVYCLDGNDHKPLNLSKIVYVDVLDNNQNPITQSKVEMKNGLGDGSIYIPVTVINGNYKFRAYTSWMKNFSPEFYFEKNLTFINPLKIPESRKENTDKLDVQFFPEGGNLVNGIASKVAFKATGTDGKGVNIKGAIIDQHNDTVTKFQTLKFGMGNFSFTPGANNAYKAVIYENGYAAVTKDLPAVNTQGYVMKLTDNGNGQLNISVKIAGYPDGNIYLFAHSRQTITAAETGTCVNGTANFSISKGSLGEGISHLTVFNTNKQPVCERLYFKRPANNLMVSAMADQQQYGLRKKISVNVAAKNADGKPLNAEMSMAVYRIDSLQEADPMNIFNYLWLSSDLRGSVESPSYYFKNDDAETKDAQDNLMLTQGWRRFQWDEVLQNKPAMFSYLPEYSGHVITAKIFNTETNTPAKNIITYLGIPGKRVQLYTAQSDSTGHLTYFTKDFFGPNEIIAETNSNIDSTFRIDLSSPFAEQYSKTQTPKFDIYPALINPLKEHSLGVQVLNIYSGDQIKRFDYPIVDSSAFYGKPFKTYKLDDFTRFTTMEEDLREYVSEDNIVNSRGRFHIKVLNERGFLDSDPLVLIDGIPVFNIDKLFTIDPLKVRKLEVVPFRYYYGPSDEEGIFSFTTYKGDLGGVDLDPKAVVMDYEGLQLHRQFYSPVYGSEAEASSRVPDFRNLLYWLPSLNGNRQGPISFYSSDQAGKYIGVVQGITNNGDAGSQYFTFDVK
jgi:hypothetical protein